MFAGIEKHHAVVVGVDVRHATGTAERDCAVQSAFPIGHNAGRGRGRTRVRGDDPTTRHPRHIARHATNEKRSVIDGRTGRN